MGTTQDLRKGITIKIGSDFYTVIDFLHAKLGRGGAHINTKLKNIKTGAVLDKTFRSGEEIKIVRLEEKQMQYLYKEQDFYYFMDMNTYEQVSLSSDFIGQASKFLRENMEVGVVFAEGNPVQIKLPTFCGFKVVETVPGVKGNTVSGGSKPARIETSAIIPVPLFVQEGDIIKIDTRTGKYVERVKN